MSLLVLHYTLTSISFSSHIGEHITSFMRYYREQFPQATILPKKHVVPWLEEWKVGLGLMGEQGAESRLRRTYQSIPNEVDRLKYMMAEHYLHVAPANAAARPPPLKRKKTSQT